MVSIEIIFLILKSKMVLDAGRIVSNILCVVYLRETLIVFLG